MIQYGANISNFVRKKIFLLCFNFFLKCSSLHYYLLIMALKKKKKKKKQDPIAITNLKIVLNCKKALNQMIKKERVFLIHI